MKILGLESSGQAAGLAIAEDGKIAAEFTLNIGLTHSQTFLPLLDSMLTLGGLTQLRCRQALALIPACGLGLLLPRVWLYLRENQLCRY